MTTLGETTYNNLKNLQIKLSNEIVTANSFEEASQMFVSGLYDSYQESISLIRLFATIPYKALPTENQIFVDNLASSKGINKLINEDTLTLCLFGSRGENAEWNDRKKSKGHLSIPLASADFIEAIPMMSRLLKELGLGLDWIESNDTELVKNTLGRVNGMFFVTDAKNEVDIKGRKIIAAQNFVEDKKIKTVFGLGGGFVFSSVFYVTIFFLRETIDKDTASMVASTMAFFNNRTKHLIKEKMFK